MPTTPFSPRAPRNLLQRCARLAAPAFGLALFLAGPALAAGAVTLSDPVPTLLDGPRVTSDVNRLAVGARPVEGVAADGVSRIVIAVSADTPGQQITFTVFDDQLAPSASSARDGALAIVGSGSFTSALITTTVATDQGSMAFVIYRAPLDFARPGSGDDNAPSRAVSIHWRIVGGTESGTIPLIILRPPVVLVHGLWSNPATWGGFTPLIDDARFAIYRANYATLEVPILLSGSQPTPVSAHALGFAFNARYVAPQIDSFLHSFKTGHNPEGIPVAAVQADVVGHSMGGNVSRWMPIMPGFASATTFKRGNIHKLITIDTPHLGSPLATDILKQANSCIWFGFYAKHYFALPDSLKTSAGVTVDGAMGDLSGGSGNRDDLSPALQALLSTSTQPSLQTRLLPTAFVAAIAGPEQLGGLDYCHAHPGAKTDQYDCSGYKMITSACGSNPLVKAMASGADWKNNVMFGQESDALVPWNSEYNGESAAAPTPLTAIHSQSLKLLGLGGPGVLEPQAGAPAQVIALLNTWVVGSAAYVSLR